MWLEIQKAVGLGLLNSLAIEVETELPEREMAKTTEAD